MFSMIFGLRFNLLSLQSVPITYNKSYGIEWPRTIYPIISFQDSKKLEHESNSLIDHPIPGMCRNFLGELWELAYVEFETCQI